MKLADVGKVLWTKRIPIQVQRVLAGVIVIVLIIQHADALREAWNWYVHNREAVVPLATGIGGLLALLVAFGQFKTARLRHEEQTLADLQRRITESFSKATEQLGSDKLEVRLGGIYTLERISKETESPETYWTVMETLTAFVRERASWKEVDASESSIFSIDRGSRRYAREVSVPTDIQAAMTVLGRRDAKGRQEESFRGWKLDLTRTDLRGVNLFRAHLEGVDLSNSHLERANLFRAHLEGASLQYGHLNGVDLNEAHLGKTNLFRAHLREAGLGFADLEGASLDSADLEQAYLANAQLEKARLGHARLIGAYLHNARLQGASLNFANLDGVNLKNANFEKADLGNARLIGASLNGARFEGANLSGANLQGGIDLDGSQIAAAAGDESTILPDGVDRPPHWTQPHS
jgi:uncharacterized protein YjbI with pentapeptide repeats